MYDKKVAAIALLVVLCVAAVWIGIGRISGDGSGADAVRRELEQIRADQQRASELLDTVKKRIDSSANRISVSTERIVTVEQRIISNQASIDESAKLIADSKRIIGEIRARGKK